MTNLCISLKSSDVILNYMRCCLDTLSHYWFSIMCPNHHAFLVQQGCQKLCWQTYRCWCLVLTSTNIKTNDNHDVEERSSSNLSCNVPTRLQGKKFHWPTSQLKLMDKRIFELLHQTNGILCSVHLIVGNGKIINLIDINLMTLWQNMQRVFDFLAHSLPLIRTKSFPN